MVAVHRLGEAGVRAVGDPWRNDDGPVDADLLHGRNHAIAVHLEQAGPRQPFRWMRGARACERVNLSVDDHGGGPHLRMIDPRRQRPQTADSIRWTGSRGSSLRIAP